MAKRTRHVKTFEFQPLHNNKRVNFYITIIGKFTVVCKLIVFLSEHGVKTNLTESRNAEFPSP